jgi:hypothetical protein
LQLICDKKIPTIFALARMRSFARGANQPIDGSTYDGRSVAPHFSGARVDATHAIDCDKLARYASRVRNRIPSCVAAM